MPAASSVSANLDLDVTDRAILAELMRDARIAWAELGRRVALTAPAARDRVRRLERAGIIDAYVAQINPANVGRGMGAFIRVATDTQPRQRRLVEFVRERPEIIECHALTGDDSIVVRAQVADMAELEALTTSLARYGRTTTSMILDTPVTWRNVPVD